MHAQEQTAALVEAAVRNDASDEPTAVIGQYHVPELKRVSVRR